MIWITDFASRRGDIFAERIVEMSKLVAIAFFSAAFAGAASTTPRAELSKPASLTLTEIRAVMATDKNLAGRSLADVDLSGMDLSGANLSGANLRGARLDHTDLKGANLSHANLNDSSLIGTNFADADMEGASIDNPTVAIGSTAKPQDVPVFRGANLDYAQILITKNDSQLGADFSHASLEHADLRHANLTNVVLKDADLKSAKLQAASLCGADLAGADFDRSELKETDFNCAKSLDQAKNLDKAQNYQKP